MEVLSTREIISLMRDREGKELQFTHFLGGVLRSTYWGRYDPESGLFGLSTDWDYDIDWTEEEIIECFGNLKAWSED